MGSRGRSWPTQATLTATVDRFHFLFLCSSELMGRIYSIVSYRFLTINHESQEKSRDPRATHLFLPIVNLAQLGCVHTSPHAPLHLPPFRHARARRGYLAVPSTQSPPSSWCPLRHSCAGRNPRSGRGSSGLQTFSAAPSALALCSPQASLLRHRRQRRLKMQERGERSLRSNATYSPGCRSRSSLSRWCQPSGPS